MCGIAGIAALRPLADKTLSDRVAAMNAAIAHRGPDGEGIWTDGQAGIALAQRRLAIVDLTPTGSQPMVSASGRLVMTYNGEIYNFRDIRRDLEAEGVAFRGTSDTEVLLEAWDRWGEARTLARLNGMFALAIWDRHARSLTLARDPFGIKPLLYAITSDGLIFASELKALLRHPACPRAIDPAALSAYLRHGAVPAPWTIFGDVCKLEPGTVMTWSGADKPSTRRRFWSPRDDALAGATDIHTGDWEQVVSDGEKLIQDSVERQMIADVPLGAFLSGGIDSSLVVALMQRSAGRPVDSFTIGFSEKAWDESPHAAAVAHHLGTRHHTLMTTGNAALDLVDDLGRVYDEPFADSSQIPTLLLCRLVREHVTVALSGDGGDETFAGYQRYDWGLKQDAYRKMLPARLRQAAATASEWLPMSIAGTTGHRLQRALRSGAANDAVSAYRQLLSTTDAPQRYLKNSAEHHSAAYLVHETDAVADPLTRMQLIDAMSYLPDDILVKVDRASMSVGLEVRVPLLDHQIWNWAMRLPIKRRRVREQGKAILRDMLARHVPPALFERPKAGFAVPLANWLRADLREWAEALLAEAHLEDGDHFDSAAVRAIWTRHLSGKEDHGPLLWSILMFQSWRAGLAHA